jgi:hypothetical protein
MENTMVIDISGEISQEAFGSLIKAYNSLSSEETLDIYINSCGGDPDYGDAIVDLIYSNKEKTKLIAYGKLFSATFDLFFKVECSKRLLDGTIGMAHLASVEMENFTVTDGRHNDSAVNSKKWWEEDKKKRLKFYEQLKMSNIELRKIKKGGDVYFQYNRLLELLNGKS